MVTQEVATFLAGQIAGYSVGGTVKGVFYNFVPEAPDQVIAVLAYGGLPPEPDMGINSGTVIRLEYPRFQVVTRGLKEDSNGPEAIARLCQAALVTILNTTLSGVSYKAVRPLQTPFPLRRDDNFRVYFVANYEAMKSPSLS